MGRLSGPSQSPLEDAALRRHDGHPLNNSAVHCGKGGASNSAGGGDGGEPAPPPDNNECETRVDGFLPVTVESYGAPLVTCTRCCQGDARVRAAAP